MDNPYNTGYEKGSSVLGPTLKFKGELKADEDLLVRGTIEGSIRHSSNLKIGKEGKIRAEVRAEYIEVHGEVNGDLTGSKAVVVKESANVSGNIYSPSVSLHEGAKFNGNIDMSGDTKSVAKPPENRQVGEEVRQEAKAGNVSAAESKVADADEASSNSAQKRKADAA